MENNNAICAGFAAFKKKAETRPRGSVFDANDR